MTLTTKSQTSFPRGMGDYVLGGSRGITPTAVTQVRRGGPAEPNAHPDHSLSLGGHCTELYTVLYCTHCTGWRLHYNTWRAPPLHTSLTLFFCSISFVLVSFLTLLLPHLNISDLAQPQPSPALAPPLLFALTTYVSPPTPPTPTTTSPDTSQPGIHPPWPDRTTTCE